MLGRSNYSQTCQKELNKRDISQHDWDNCKDLLHCKIVNNDSSRVSTSLRNKDIEAPCQLSNRNLLQDRYYLPNIEQPLCRTA